MMRKFLVVPMCVVSIGFLFFGCNSYESVRGDNGGSQGFSVIPGDIPNDGILFVDHEKSGRSGHGHSTITECENGDILAFYANTGREGMRGHGVAGWSEYKRSTDGGETWSDPIVFEYSKQAWESDGVYSAMVFSLETAPNGTLIATVLRYDGNRWHIQLPPVYLLSYDNGHTWTEAREFDASADKYDLARTYDTSFVHDGEVFIVFFGDSGDMDKGRYTLWVSDDNGESFSKRSELPFDHRNFYAAAGALDDGRIIVYSYPWRRGGDTDEKNIPYVISEDGGRSWSEVKTAYFEKSIRNPQMSDKIGDYYFLHGRSGHWGDAPRHLVLYKSKDGINWDSGTFLNKGATDDLDSYSANAVIGRYDPSKPNRLLIQSSIAYDESGRKVNIHHWWVNVNE